MDRTQLEALYRREWPQLVGVAYSMTDSMTIAEEIVQDAFAKLQTAGAPVRKPGAYLYTAVVNGCRDHYRRRAVVARSIRPTIGPALNSYDEIDSYDEMSSALATLPWRQRAALVLRFYLDYPEREIARVLNCRPATVRSLHKRALAALRKELE